MQWGAPSKWARNAAMPHLCLQPKSVIQVLASLRTSCRLTRLSILTSVKLSEPLGFSRPPHCEFQHRQSAWPGNVPKNIPTCQCGVCGSVQDGVCGPLWGLPPSQEPVTQQIKQHCRRFVLVLFPAGTRWRGSGARTCTDCTIPMASRQMEAPCLHRSSNAVLAIVWLNTK